MENHEKFERKKPLLHVIIVGCSTYFPLLGFFENILLKNNFLKIKFIDVVVVLVRYLILKFIYQKSKMKLGGPKKQNAIRVSQKAK